MAEARQPCIAATLTWWHGRCPGGSIAVDGQHSAGCGQSWPASADALAACPRRTQRSRRIWRAGTTRIGAASATPGAPPTSMTADPTAGPVISVVVPARNAEATLGACLRALAAQSMAASQFETIVVVDRDSDDATAQLAHEAGVRVQVSKGSGPAAARNAGIKVARGPWIAFTDADCIPSRTWLSELLRAVEASGSPALGAAGATLGYRSTSDAARFVDLSGGLHAERHLAHERYPWAPTANVMYRREALDAVGGFDDRFRTYEGCDLHTRLRRQVGGSFAFAARAIVMHHHRPS